jgi:hypothetical protein
MDTLFDPAGAAEAREDGIARVDKHANPDWKLCALEAVERVAQVFPEFNTDMTVKHLAVIYPGVETHDDRAWGPVMRRAAKLGYIEPTNRVSQSVLKSNHRRPKRIWRSLLIPEENQ